MRLVYPDPLLEINFSNHKIHSLIVENTSLFISITEDLWNQSNGDDGVFILSNKDKLIKFDKKADVIINPFSVSSNDRKIITKIYAELNGIGQENSIEELLCLNSSIVGLIDHLAEKVPYPLIYDLNLDLSGLLKLYNVKIDEECTELLEKLMTYVKLMHQVCGITLFVFVNLKQYFSLEQLNLFYQNCLYEEVSILDIEGCDLKKKLDCEKEMIIDKDLCIISI